MCPITHERFLDPVIAADGHTYEREAIESWLKEHSNSPVTRMPMDSRLVVNNNMRQHLNLPVQIISPETQKSQDMYTIPIPSHFTTNAPAVDLRLGEVSNITTDTTNATLRPQLVFPAAILSNTTNGDGRRSISIIHMDGCSVYSLI